MANSKKAIVIGASSGIGAALARVLGANGYEVGLVARRLELLRQVQQETRSKTYIKQIDVSQVEQAMAVLQELIKEMGGLDLIVLNSGINNYNTNLTWQGEIELINVNVSGFVACACVAIKHFLAQNSGQIAGISSIAGLRGSAGSPAYNASKAFVSNYLEGLRHKLNKNNIYVTDIRPGLVDTTLIDREAMLFWLSTPEAAAEQIFTAIKHKRKVAYITRRWGVIAWLVKILPDWAYRLRYTLGPYLAAKAKKQ